MLARRVTRALLAGGGSPAALGPEQAALALALDLDLTLARGLALGLLGLRAWRAELWRQWGKGRKWWWDAVLGLS